MTAAHEQTNEQIRYESEKNFQWQLLFNFFYFLFQVMSIMNNCTDNLNSTQDATEDMLQPQALFKSMTAAHEQTNEQIWYESEKYIQWQILFFPTFSSR